MDVHLREAAPCIAAAVVAPLAAVDTLVVVDTLVAVAATTKLLQILFEKFRCFFQKLAA